jgi:hypothetical protein
MLGELARAPGGATPDELAERLDLDPFYVSVWCRAALSGGICDRYRLAPHVATLLLDTGSPAYVGGLFTVLEQREMFGRFEANLASGERLWWDGSSPDWIAGVAGTGTPFYTRLVPAGGADRQQHPHARVPRHRPGHRERQSRPDPAAGS